MREEPPRRKAWLKFLKEVADYVNATENRSAEPSGDIS